MTRAMRLGAIDQWVETRWHYRRSLASRVTLLTTMAVGLAVAFVALGAYVTARVQMQATLDSSLLDRAHAAADSSVLSDLSQLVPSEALGAGDIRIAFLEPDGVVHSLDKGSKLELGQPELDVAAGRSAEAVRTLVSEKGIRYRVVTVPSNTGNHTVALVLAQSLEPQDKVLAKLGLVMLLFGAAGVLAAALAGWAVARNGLRPVRRLTDAVEEIARTEDLRPLLVEGDDEIARLATAFNSMLRSLEASRDRQRQLVADAGHELRTPLTSLRTNLDLLSQADSAEDSGLPPEARAELLDDVSAQIAELTTLIGDLIELARDEPIVGGVVEPVDVGEVVDRALTRVRLRAPSVRWATAVEPWLIDGEVSPLERAVTNLLDNAAKWSPPDGTVTVRLIGGTLTVSDEGPGIPEEDLPHVFDRFYRSVSSRSMPGSGLGLSIVRQVVERHGGTVSARTGPVGGALFTVTLPAES
jgi:two-component system sensor histidine kinase MprB